MKQHLTKAAISVLLAAAVLLSSLCLTVTATEESQPIVWDGALTEPTADADGDGLIDISQPAELAWVVGNHGNGGGNYELLCDIYLNDVTQEDWATSDTAKNAWFGSSEGGDAWNVYKGATESATFSGTLAGNGFTVYGIYHAPTAQNGSAGLIPAASSATVKDLSIKDSYIVNAQHYAGAVIGATTGGTVVIENCSADGTVTVSATSNAGGILAYAQTGTNVTVKNCRATANVSAKTAGGILGLVYVGKNATNTLSVTGCISDKSIIGRYNVLGTLNSTVNGNGVIWDGTYQEPTADTDGDGYLDISLPSEFAWAIGNFGQGNKYELLNHMYLNDTTNANWKTDSPNLWFVGAGKWNVGYTGADGATVDNFSGTIDGNGNTVYGIYNSDNASYEAVAGLIPRATDATVKNLMIKDSEVTETRAGALCGVAQKLTAENVYIDSSVTVNGATDCGGIVGYVASGYSASFESCASKAELVGTNCGGLVGNSYKGTVVAKNSYVSNFTALGKIGSSKLTIENVYCPEDYTGTPASVSGEQTILTESKMTGRVAAGFMPGLGNGFITTENGTPVQKVFASDEGITLGFSGGSGTEQAPFLLSTPEDLYYAIGGHGNGKVFKLTNDIDLTDFTAKNDWLKGIVWTDGYGFSADYKGFFMGTIDGGGYAVSGLNYTSDTERIAGLIPATNGTVTVKNLGLESSSIKAMGVNGYAGGIIGFANAATVIVDKCYVTSDVSIAGAAGFAGGIVGYTNGATTLTVTNSYTKSHTVVDYIHKSATVSISESYSLGSLPYRTDKALGTLTLENVYSDKSDEAEGLITLTSLEGKDALSSMTELDGSIWYPTSSSPMLRVRGTAMGDVDEDGSGIDAEDLAAERLILMGANTAAHNNGDYDRSNTVTICDLVALSNAYVRSGMAEIVKTYGEYYGAEMSVVSKKLDTVGTDAVNYIFITDIHYSNGASAQDAALLNQMQAITNMANADDSIDFVVIGGDITTGTYSTKADCIENMSEVLAPLKKCTKPVLILAGNHDDNCYHVYSKGYYDTNLILSDMDWNTQVLSPNAPSGIVHDSEYEHSKYYYYDLPDKKTRIVCLDAIDYRAPFDPETGAITEMLAADFENNTYYGKENVPARQYRSGASYWDYSAEQLDWLVNEALTEEDYNYVFLSHMGIDSDTNSGGETVNAGFRDKLRDIIEAYQNKGTYTDTASDLTADFSDHGGKILSYQFGHIHIELTMYSEDIDLWQICSASANVGQSDVQTAAQLASSSLNNKELDWNPVVRSLGTKSEAFFDIMSVSESAVYKFNIGTGSTETMTYSK